MKPLPKTSCRFLALPLLLFALAGMTHFDAGAQSMGISSSAITPDASSILEMRTTSKGLLIPRMTTAERDAITSPATGLMVFNTTSNKFNFYNGSSWTVLFSGTSGLNSITGTSNRITIGGTAADPTVDISSGYAGQNSITTLGTITTGTWNGTIITSAYGGTGNGFTKFSGPTTSEKTFTLPDASATILTSNAAVTVAQGGTGVGTITGLIKGNGTSAFTAATSGTDYSAGTSALTTGILKSTTSTGALSIAVPADFPTLNQNTTGSAATLTTSRNIYGNAFNGSADLAQVIASTYGGTGNGFTKFSGPTTSEKSFTLPNTSATILTDNATVTAVQGGTGQSVYTTGDLLVAGSSTTLSKLSAVAAGSYLRSAGTSTVPVWSTTTLPNSATTGDLLFANASNTYANLAGVATGNALLSSGVSTAPSWGKIGLTTHVSGILPVANGGTNSSAALNNNRIIVSSGGAITEAAALTNGSLLIGSTSAAPVAAMLTAGNGIVITNGAGSITIANEPTITETTATSTVTTTSLTDVALSTPLSITPGAGDYLVFFNGLVSNSNSGKYVNMSLYVNNTKLAVSEREVNSASGNDKNIITIQAYITGLGAGQAIEVRWRTESNTSTITNRSLIVQKVK
jgi:hypothetical protein